MNENTANSVNTTDDISPDEGSEGRNYVLFLLFMVYTFNFIDRQILVILQEPIKLELGLSDLQLGILSGFSFAIFYVTAGIPIAKMADSGNRRNIIAYALTVWSGMTAISGLATNYMQLVAARIGVGIGEAGCSPPAHSMISDMFPAKKRATALSIYSSGIFLGIFIGYLIAGYVQEAVGWRMTFMIVGLPGILLAIIFRLTVKEPKRRISKKAATDVSLSENESTLETIKSIWAIKSFRYVSLGCAVSAFVGYGVGGFFPSYLIRSHGMGLGDVGLALSLIMGIGGMIGTLLGGYLTDKVGGTDKRWYLWLPGFAASSTVPMYVWIYQSNNLDVILMVSVVPFILATMYLGPCIAVAHMLVESRKRAMVSALLFFILNLIGLGFGPMCIGWLSDTLQQTYGTDGLRHAMSIGVLLALVQGYLFWKGGKQLPADLAKIG